MSGPPGGVTNRNGWDEWRNHVLSELKRFNDNNSQTQNALADIRTEIAKLQVKASLWGGIMGLVTAGLMIVVKIVL